MTTPITTELPPAADKTQPIVQGQWITFQEALPPLGELVVVGWHLRDGFVAELCRRVADGRTREGWRLARKNGTKLWERIGWRWSEVPPSFENVP